ncbi:MAG: hypothetical protein R3244_10400, partial [Thermoanaerobaculia bacterium]|nr:hypothetical protein [Thermoanaerobaculia bacterium]
LEAVDEDLREAPPEPPEEPVEAAETVRAAEPETTKEPPRPPKPPRDPAAALEERIRQAAEEGKRLAASARRSRAPGDDLGRSTDTLLEQALAGLDEERPRRRRRPARATEEEVDDLVGSVVDDGEPEEDDETRTGSEPGDSSEAPALDLFERDERELEEGEYRTRLKLIWAIILIVALGILAIVLIGRGGPETGTTEPPDVPAEEMTQPSAEPSGDADAEGDELPSEGEEAPASDEETLEQELEAQRRQLQDEIARSRATGEDGP